MLTEATLGLSDFTMPKPSLDRSPMALALDWSSTIISISVAMVVPGLAGYWLDGKLGTGFVFLLLGMVLGVVVGIWQLVRLTQKKTASKSSPRDSEV